MGVRMIVKGLHNQNYLKTILTKNNNFMLSSKDIANLTILIPELKPMFNFDHKHPHHHLDVWKHTLCALSLSENNFELRLALLLHDVGKPHSFTEEDGIRHFKGHAEVSAKLCNKILQRLNFNQNFIEEICQVIKQHDTPLTEEFIENNYKLAEKIFNVQTCDALAHNPAMNAKRIEYIEQTKELFKNCNNLHK